MERTVQILNLFSIVYTVYSTLKKIRSRRRWWVRPVNRTRDIDGFFVTCFSKIKRSDPDHFVKMTRMSASKFDSLLGLLMLRLERSSPRRPIAPDVRLAITLIYLAHGCSPQMLAWSFKMGVSTVREIIYSTCDSIWEELHGVYVASPNSTEWRDIARRFWAEKRMPNCIGAIDGKHITVKCPRRSGSLFYNYKKRYSIVLLAACDTKYRFTLVDVGAVGSQSDGGVFARSSFGRKILNGTFGVPEPKHLPDENIMFPHYFVGDAAFPLKANLMRPYPGRTLPHVKSNFNARLSKARVLIENAFGILANRWRVLSNDLYCSPQNADKIVLATIALHNFLITDGHSDYFSEELVDRECDGEIIPGDWREDGVELASTRIFRANRTTTAAFSLRDDLANYLARQ